jgi:mannosyltransferase
MSSPSGLALLRRAAGSPPASARRAARDTGDLLAGRPGPWWMRILPPVVTAAVMLTGVTVPSYWRDEAATLAAVRRPFGDMIAMLGNVDAVHGAYYMLAWVVARLFGTGELALRLPSVIAMTVAAGFVAALGRRLVSPQAGLAAGLLFAVVPDISLYGQDARSYAMVTATATIASYLLVRALGARHGRQRRWWVGYGFSLAVLGILNIFGLLLLAGHAVTMAVRMLAPQEGQSRRALAIRWSSAAAGAAVVTSPLMAAAWFQRGQLSWLTAPGSAGLASVTKLIGPPFMALAAVAVLIAGVAVTAWRGHERGSRRLSSWRPLAVLCVPWLVLPPAILLIGSAVTPV